MREIGTMGRVSVDRQNSKSINPHSTGLFASGMREEAASKETFEL